MPDNPFSNPEINAQIKAKVLRLQAASLEWDDNPAGRGFDDHIVETLVANLDAHAASYLHKANSENLISQYCEHLRGVGSKIISNAEQRSVLSDPYSEDRLRQMAENSGRLVNGFLTLTAEQKEAEIRNEVERIRAEFMAEAKAWHEWSNQISSRIASRFGVEFTGDGVRLAPVIPLDSYRFQSQLLGLVRSPAGYEGWYSPAKPGSWTIHLRLSEHELVRVATSAVNDRRQAPLRSGSEILLTGQSPEGKPMRWAVHFS